MKRLLVILIALTACRSSDGNARSAPAQGAGAAAAAVDDSASDDALLARADSARIQGNPSAPVWLVELSDFQCGFCKVWHEETYPAIVREYVVPGHVRMAYVNFPLQQHPHGMAASEAAMCAAAQGSFWPMHDALFATQGRWAALRNASAYFDSLASTHVDRADWGECMRSGLMRRLIAADRSRGLAARIGSTPTFFVGDERIEGAQPLAVFRAAIERARAKAAGRSPPSP